MSDKKETGLIYAAIPAIMKDIPSIAKDRRNKEQGYQFRGIDEVYAAVNPILAKHGVFMRAEVQSVTREERPSKSGGVLAFVQVRVRYYFVAADGSSVFTDSLGEGMDSGDKATPKSMSIAQKYAILQMFCVPTADAKDPEHDSPEPAPKPKPTPKPRPAADPLDDHYSSEDAADKSAQFRNIPLTMSDGKTRMHTKFEAYKKFGNLKIVLGDERYYEALKSGGYAHANEIPDKALPTMYAVLLAKKQQIDEEGAAA